MDDMCCLCKQREASFDGAFCSRCAHEMWDYADEIRDVITWAIYMSEAVDIKYAQPAPLVRSVNALRCKMGADDG